MIISYKQCMLKQNFKNRQSIWNAQTFQNRFKSLTVDYVKSAWAKPSREPTFLKKQRSGIFNASKGWWSSRRSEPPFHYSSLKQYKLPLLKVNIRSYCISLRPSSWKWLLQTALNPAAESRSSLPPSLRTGPPLAGAREWTCLTFGPDRWSGATEWPRAGARDGRHVQVHEATWTVL